jgi:hypothetical protein
MIWGVLSLYALRTVGDAPVAPPTEATHLVQQHAVPPISDS